MGRPTCSTAILAALALSLAPGCPTRTNPALGDATGDSDVDADADDGGDGGDADVDADQECDGELIACEGGCVSPLDEGSCGGCGWVCTSDPECSCEGSPPSCVWRGERACYAECGDGAIVCDEDCVPQPDDFDCGVCGRRCEGGSGCSCRRDDESGDYECLRSAAGSWQPC